MQKEEPWVLAGFARAVARQREDLSMPQRLCQAAVELFNVAGAAITMSYTHPDRVTLCATDDVAARLEDLQEVLGQGPGPIAYDTGRPVHAALARGDDRWPQLTAAARDGLDGIVVHALPLMPDRRVVGVLTCHQPGTREWSIGESATTIVTNAIGTALVRDPDATNLDTAGPWSQRAQTHQAVGMVMAQLGISPPDALALLRAHAFTHDQALADIVAAVTARDLTFTEPKPRPGRGRDEARDDKDPT